MCLLTVTKTYSPPDPEERTAYKLLARQDNQWFTPCMYNKVFLDIWLQATTEVIPTDDYSATYPAGFHVYPTREMAEEAKEIMYWLKQDQNTIHLVEVKVRNVHTEGYDNTDSNVNHLTNLVAHAMYVSKEAIDVLVQHH